MLPLAALVVLSYLTFIFFSENLNPFIKPPLPMNRHRWRYGRRMASAVLAGGLCTFLLIDMASVTTQPAIALGGGVAVLLGLGFSAKKIGYSLRR